MATNTSDFPNRVCTPDPNAPIPFLGNCITTIEEYILAHPSSGGPTGQGRASRNPGAVHNAAELDARWPPGVGVSAPGGALTAGNGVIA